MIPVTAPNIIVGGVPKVQVNVLSSVSGLTKWIDYIPVVETAAAGAYLNTYGFGANVGAIAVNSISSGTKWIDYVPVFIVGATGQPWVDYIPVNGSGGGAFFSNGVNLFFNKAAYDAYGVAVSGGTRTLATDAGLASLGITNAGGINGTYYNSLGVMVTKAAGTAPRLSYAFGTTNQNFLLSEEARTNKLLWNRDHTNVAWTTFSGFGASTTSPDGTANMQKIVPGVGSNDYYMFQGATMTNATRCVWSAYFKQGGFTWVEMRPTDSGAGLWRASFNLATGVVGTLAGTGTTAGIEAGPNGTYRCWIAFTPTATGTGNHTFFTVNADNTQTVVGDGVNGIYSWGHQAEDGALLTTLINTTTATVTRTADDTTQTITATNIATTVIAGHTNAGSASVTDKLIEFNDGTGNNYILLYFSEQFQVINQSIRAGNVAQADGGVSANRDIDYVVSARNQNNAFSASINGGAISNYDISGTAPLGMTKIALGATNAFAAGSLSKGPITRWAYSPTAANDAQMVLLSAGTL